MSENEKLEQAADKAADKPAKGREEEGREAR